MRTFNLSGFRNLLLLGAHADDIEIGCGGTILKLVREQPGLNVLWVVFSAEGARSAEARRSTRELLKGAGKQRVIVKDFTASFFPYEARKIKDMFEELKHSFAPDVVFTHYRDDRHQDHRILSDLAWNTWRNHLILEYEIPKYDGDLGIPNVFVEIDEPLCRKKSRHICEFFQTQSNKQWLSEDTFLGLMRLRGIECASRTKYAEAFHCRKLVLGAGAASSESHNPPW